MSSEETELTFIRCPSCRSLVPALATRCRMCGHYFDSEGESGGDDQSKRKSRVRQRTISVSKDEIEEVVANQGEWAHEASPSRVISEDDEEEFSPPPAPYEAEDAPEEKPLFSRVSVPEDDLFGRELASAPEMDEELPPWSASSEESAVEPETAALTEAAAFEPPPAEPKKEEPAPSWSRSSKPIGWSLGRSVQPAPTSPPPAEEETLEDEEDYMAEEDEADDAAEAGSHSSEEPRQPGKKKRRRRRKRRGQGGEAAAGPVLEQHAAPVQQPEPEHVVPEPEHVVPEPEKADTSAPHLTEIREERDHRPEPVAEHRAEPRQEHREPAPDLHAADRPHRTDTRPAFMRPPAAALRGEPETGRREEPKPGIHAAGADEKKVETIHSVSSESKRETMAVQESSIHESAFGPRQHTGPAAEEPGVSPQDEGVLLGWLVSFAAEAKGSAVELRGGRFFIGRQRLRKNDMVISDSAISTPHCMVAASPNEGLKIQDLMSEQGTFIKRRGKDSFTPVRDVVSVEHGDCIRFGGYEVLVCLVPYGGRK